MVESCFDKVTDPDIRKFNRKDAIKSIFLWIPVNFAKILIFF